MQDWYPNEKMVNNFSKDVNNAPFLNIQRRADYPQAMYKFEISHMFVIMKQNIGRCNVSENDT